MPSDTILAQCFGLFVFVLIGFDDHGLGRQFAKEQVGDFVFVGNGDEIVGFRIVLDDFACGKGDVALKLNVKVAKQACSSVVVTVENFTIDHVDLFDAAKVGSCADTDGAFAQILDVVEADVQSYFRSHGACWGFFQSPHAAAAHESHHEHG